MGRRPIFTVANSVVYCSVLVVSCRIDFGSVCRLAEWEKYGNVRARARACVCMCVWVGSLACLRGFVDSSLEWGVACFILDTMHPSSQWTHDTQNTSSVNPASRRRTAQASYTGISTTGATGVTQDISVDPVACFPRFAPFLRLAGESKLTLVAPIAPIGAQRHL